MKLITIAPNLGLFIRVLLCPINSLNNRSGSDPKNVFPGLKK